MNIVSEALECIENGIAYFCKYLTPNDVGINGAHQGGIYVSLEDGKKIFPKPFRKGENVHAGIEIQWYGSKISRVCNFIYYGKALRTNEFRITRLNRKFQENDFFILVLVDEEYIGFVLDEDQAREFLGSRTSV
ncbi:hypothetical protein GEO21_03555 [Sphingobacterium faecium]|jgi:hypothetical protein|uniref:EcoRII N-terminal effector-binding domain-containing protein n=1 Tax=Sphingobacterium faecium TaxID=34087 RepID=UPI001291227F|nr:EcoRII N-terminal effector-binding domain-containing protein [Sphingobacterium faecium]MQP26591.1 hypothetical protein [Sphingobacterium faecium]